MMDDAAYAPEATQREGRRSTHFIFEHKVFGVKGARFAPTSDTREAALHVLLGDLQVAIVLPTLRHEFGIRHDSKDGELLGIVERSLRFVKEIRPNDSIPRELLDGTASWAVQEHHLQIAKGRLSLQISSWLTGEEAVIVDREALEQMVEDPKTKRNVERAFGEIAEKLGLGRDRRGEIVDRIDELARELSYIEALRERYGHVKRALGTLNQLVRTYRGDRGVTQEISRIRTLLLRPEEEFDNLFAQCDAMTGEIVSVLKTFEAQVEFVRDMRDQLHSKLMLWDEIIELWKTVQPVRGETTEAAIKEIYRFAARNYPQRKDWRANSRL